MNNRALTATGWGKLALALLMVVVVFAAEVVGVFAVMALNISDESLWSSIIPELCGAVAAVASVIALGGWRWATISLEDVAYTFRFGWWCMLISVLLMVYTVASYVMTGTPVSSDWLMGTVECALFCLAIGVLEEFMFRGLIFGGLLAVMGGSHRGLVAAVYVGALFFGLAHLDFAEVFTDTISMVQAVLKVIQTGMYAILLSVIMLRTKRLGSLCLFHALDDFLIITPGVAFFDESFHIDYVADGDEAITTIVFYVLVIALYTPFVVKALRELRRGQDVCRGPFMERAVAQARRREELLAARAAQEAAGTYTTPALPQLSPSGPPDPFRQQPYLDAPEQRLASVVPAEPMQQARPTDPATPRAVPDFLANATERHKSGRPPAPFGM